MVFILCFRSTCKNVAWNIVGFIVPQSMAEILEDVQPEDSSVMNGAQSVPSERTQESLVGLG